MVVKLSCVQLCAVVCLDRVGCEVDVCAVVYLDGFEVGLCVVVFCDGRSLVLFAVVSRCGSVASSGSVWSNVCSVSICCCF